MPASSTNRNDVNGGMDRCRQTEYQHFSTLENSEFHSSADKKKQEDKKCSEQVGEKY